MAKITLEDIRRSCKQHGWTCDSGVYTNLKTPMTFHCDEGHLVYDTWEKIRNKFKCPTCDANLKTKIVNIAGQPKTKEYRVLALDQSSHKTGYSIYDGNKLIGYGVYETNKRDIVDRIMDVCDWLNSMILAWKPDMVGLEETLYNANFAGNRTDSGVANHDVFRMLTQVMGALMRTAALAKCEVGIVKIASWRHHCGVKGRTRTDQKRSAQLLVKDWHDISVTDDESDAICIGKYFADNHLNSKPTIGDLDW